MDLRQLGSRGPQLSTIGFGAWALGGAGWRFSWGAQDTQDSIAAIQRALDLGVNWIDTAAVYGLGYAEEVVGQALRGRRNQALIATKCGRVWDADGNISTNLHPKNMRQELEDSLRRLDVDVIDLYQIHWPDPNIPIEEVWGQMTRFVEDGKVRYIGVSNFDLEQLQRCEAIHHVDSLQPPYSLIRRAIEADLLPYCAAQGIGVIVYSPMQSGLLSGNFDIQRLAPDDWRRNGPFFQEPQLSRNLAFVERLRPIAQRYGKSVGQLAIAWVLRQAAVTSAIVGFRQPDQVAQNLGGAGWTIESNDLAQIEQVFADTIGVETKVETASAPSRS
ncbi:MAG: aldo/keto reductase [Chloroflexales bacterium]|nr:aldo/keto reductase [Chloroflexales bacterium]